MPLLLLAILLISSVTCLGSFYARKYEKPDGLIALYIIFVAVSQITAARIAVFDFGFATVTAPAAVIIFAVTFLLTDIVNEKFGRRAVHSMIFITFVTQVVMLAFITLAGAFPPAPFWQGQDAWNQLLGVVPRITLASWITFLVSENLDAWLFAFFRKLTNGRHLWARNLFSSLPALTVDTLLFVTLAFAGTGLPLWAIMAGQFSSKYLVTLINIPFIYLNRSILGKRLAGAERRPASANSLPGPSGRHRP